MNEFIDLHSHFRQTRRKYVAILRLLLRGRQSRRFCALHLLIIDMRALIYDSVCGQITKGLLLLTGHIINKAKMMIKFMCLFLSLLCWTLWFWLDEKR